MSKEMLINVSEGEECRIAIVENGRLEEIYMERASATSHVGNIYKGRVTNVEPAIQAAFVDFGQGRNGFLHISDLLPSYFGKRGEDISESVGRKMSRRERPPIQRCLKRGDEITVQIIKEGIGTKGPTLSTYLSIPGRILVMMPGMENFGVSRKIEDEQERRRLRKILDELDPIEGVGFIIRTAGMGKTKAEIEKDLKYLTRLWETISKIQATTRGPVELYTEGDLVTRTVRDVYGPDIDRIIVDSRDVAKRVKDFIRLTSPRSKTRVEYYDQPIPLFHAYNIEREIELIHSRHVPLPSGGSLVIDSTEAVVAIDVNSGKFRDHSDAETTAFKTDMEAADEIPRQLKLRDLGGVIICDFIDLRYERHRRQLEQRLFENFKRDKAKTRVLRMSEFGIIEITRQRMRPSLKRSIYHDCPSCGGHGLVKTPESMALDVMRKLAIAVHDDRVARAQVGVAPEVAVFLANRRRKQLVKLEEDSGVPIEIKPQTDIALDAIRFELFDDRDGRVYLEALGMTPEGGERAHRSAAGRRDGRDGNAKASNGRAQPSQLRTIDPDDDGADDAADAPERPTPRKDRPEDHIKPIGIEPARSGAGHRGPHVVVPADQDERPEQPEGDGEPSETPAQSVRVDGPAPVEGVSEGGGGDGESDPGESGGRRRRRRRRGGRGRRRGRDGQTPGGPEPADQAALADPNAPGTSDPAATNPPDHDASDVTDFVEDDRFAVQPGDLVDEASETSVGSAPTAIGDDEEDAPTLARKEAGYGFDADDRMEVPDFEPQDAEATVSQADQVPSGTSATRRAEDSGEPEAGDARGRRRRRGGRGRGARSVPRGTTAGTDPAGTTQPTAEGEQEAESSLEVASEPATPAETAAESGPAKSQTPSDGEEVIRPGGRRRSRGRGRSRRGGAKADALADEPAETGTGDVPGAGRADGPEVAAARRSEQTNPAGSSSDGLSRAKPAVVSAPVRRMPTPVNVPPPIPTRKAPTPVAVPPALPGATLGVKVKAADKHLADDEPVEPQPLRRPRSVRDLDAIPEDVD